jgi:hypothetical protein
MKINGETMQNIDIIDILDELECFSDQKKNKKLLKVTLTPDGKTKNLSQTELFNLFQNNLTPYVEEAIISSDNFRKTQAEKQNTPEALKASMSYDFINDVLVYSQYYLSQLDFTYFLKTGKNLFLTGDHDSKFLAPLSMLLHIRNLLVFTSFKAIKQLQLDLQDIYLRLLDGGYCTSDENDPNLPALQLSIIQIETSFTIECSNNFLSINAPLELKQELYFRLIKNFIKEIFDELEFNFVNIDEDPKKDFINIYPSLMKSHRTFLAHMTAQLIQQYH